MKLRNILFFAILLFGVLLRSFKIGSIPFSLFSDEVDIGYQVYSFSQNQKDYQGNFLPLQFHSFSDVRTSLPIYSTYLVSLMPGVDIERAIRITPLLFAIGSLFLIYRFTNIFFDSQSINQSKNVFTSGHFALLILSLLPWHFTYSRTAFELSQLLFFNLLGFYLFLVYTKTRKVYLLILSLVTLGLTPLIYSTAKLAIFGYPILLWLISDLQTRKTFIRKWYIYSILFVPLVVIVLNGGASKRFSEISIFTDPTISSEVNFSRQLDLGNNLVVGSSPSMLTKIAHNKLEYIGSRLIKNILTPLSTSFLFIKGDPNLRHAVSDWGMLLKTSLAFISFGLIFLIQKKDIKLSIFVLISTILAIVPSALTRDGMDHSSRLFMLIFPLLLLATLGFEYLRRNRFAQIFLIFVMLIESFFYFHDYFKHYPYEAEKYFHYGLKEVVELSENDNKISVISPRYEPPLIFYLFYTKFPPSELQELYKNNKIRQEISSDINLEGYQLRDKPVYMAFILNHNAKEVFPMNAVYYITPLEASAIFGERYKEIKPAVVSPSGLPIYYKVDPQEIAKEQ